MIEKIRRILEKNKDIAAAYLYGSAAAGNERKDSDIDIALLMEKEPREKNPYFESEIALMIEKELKTKRPVDVKVINNATIMFAGQVIRKGKLIFSNNDRLVGRFELMALDRYFDFLPFIREYNRIREKRLGVGA